MLRTLLALLAVVALAGCGGDEGPESSSGTAGDPATEPQTAVAAGHIHGLASGAGGRLYVATHGGLFIVGAAGAEPQPVGGERDLMGFSDAGGGRFVASGHPAPTSDEPNPLGLVESKDDGQTWEPVSLEGEADFHALTAAGPVVAGYDAHAGGLQVSRDGGRTWTKREVPAPVFDLALDPRDPGRIVAATDAGIFRSADGGRRWERRDGGRTGLLAWPRGEALFLVGPDGEVAESADDGRTWQARGSIGGQPAAFAAVTGGKGGTLFAALGDGRVLRSPDGGRSWDSFAQLG